MMFITIRGERRPAASFTWAQIEMHHQNNGISEKDYSRYLKVMLKQIGRVKS